MGTEMDDRMCTSGCRQPVCEESIGPRDITSEHVPVVVAGRL